MLNGTRGCSIVKSTEKELLGRMLRNTDTLVDGSTTRVSGCSAEWCQTSAFTILPCSYPISQVVVIIRWSSPNPRSIECFGNPKRLYLCSIATSSITEQLQDFCDSRVDVSEEIEANIGAFVYYFELGMGSWYVNDACEWRGRFCNGRKRYGNGNGIQALSARRSTGDGVDEALVACEIVTSGELKASVDAITPIL